MSSTRLLHLSQRICSAELQGDLLPAPLRWPVSTRVSAAPLMKKDSIFATTLPTQQMSLKGTTERLLGNREAGVGKYLG
jgi:hypothetical protein